MVHIFDDIIPKQYQDMIEQRVMGGSWFYTGDMTVNDIVGDYKKRPGAYHQLVDVYGHVNSETWDFVLPMIVSSLDKAGLMYTHCLMARAFLQYPLSENIVGDAQTHDPLHVDRQEDHTVVLYYVNDSDGDTVIYNKRKTSENSEPIWDYSELEIIHRVQPKKGRVVVFDGSLYHTAYQPRNNMRCIINADIV
jgi:hypothetical protein